MKFILKITGSIEALLLFSVSAVADSDLDQIKIEAAAEAFLMMCAHDDFSAKVARDRALRDNWNTLPEASVAVNRPNMTVTQANGWAFVPGDIYPAMLFMYVYEGNHPDLGDIDVCKLFFREQNPRGVMKYLTSLPEVKDIETDVSAEVTTHWIEFPGYSAALGVAEFATGDDQSIYLSAVHQRK